MLYGLPPEKQRELVAVLKEIREYLGISHSELIDRIMLKGPRAKRN